MPFMRKPDPKPITVTGSTLCSLKNLSTMIARFIAP